MSSRPPAATNGCRATSNSRARCNPDAAVLSFALNVTSRRPPRQRPLFSRHAGRQHAPHDRAQGVVLRLRDPRQPLAEIDGRGEEELPEIAPDELNGEDADEAPSE